MPSSLLKFVKTLSVKIGGSDYLCKWVSPLVLTYFKNTPYGNDLLGFNYDSYFTQSSMNINGVVYPSMKMAVTPNNQTAGNNVDISNFSKVSLDYFVKATLSSYEDYNQIYGIGRFIRFYKDSNDIKIQIDSNPGSSMETIGQVSEGSIVHIGCVYDRGTKKSRTFINGNFANELEVNESVARVRCSNKFTNCSIECTQWCLREGDYSTDGGTKYPVPSNPYYPIRNFSI